jgi:hypothetical protein
VVEPVSAVSVIDVVGGAAVPVAGRLEAIAGQPKRLFVSLGRLTIVVYDRAAYGSLRTAFATARETAAAVFHGQPADLRTVAGEIAARAMGPGQPTGRTPRSAGTAHTSRPRPQTAQPLRERSL